MKVFFISGLGADSRVFYKIKLPKGFETVHLNWIPPENEESLTKYAARMAEGINPSKPFGLIGLSMGGMVASEIARITKPSFVVLISSCASSLELPFYFNIFYKLKLYKIPVSWIKKSSTIKRLFTSETNEDKNLIRQVINESDSNFLKWAMQAVLEWKQPDRPENYIHIHGSRDEILPLRFTKPNYVVEKAKHMMVLTHAKRINEILDEVLQPYS